MVNKKIILIIIVVSTLVLAIGLYAYFTKSGSQEENNSTNVGEGTNNSNIDRGAQTIFRWGSCGDGMCYPEVTCAAIGCPQAENPVNCPEDCER